MITSVLLKFAVPLPGLPLSNAPLPAMDKLEFRFELGTVPVGPVMPRLFTQTLLVDAEPTPRVVCITVKSNVAGPVTGALAVMV